MNPAMPTARVKQPQVAIEHTRLFKLWFDFKVLTNFPVKLCAYKTYQKALLHFGMEDNSANTSTYLLLRNIFAK